MKNKASVLHRLIAGIIDYSLLLLVYLLPFFYLSAAENINGFLNQFLTLAVFFFVIFPLLYPLIISLFISRLGGTLGKLLTGTKIVNSQNKNLSFKRAFFRNFIGHIVSGTFFFLGFIWIAIDKERRGWHDQIADTYVVVVNPKGLILGIISLSILLGVNLNFGVKTYHQFTANKHFYFEVINDIASEPPNPSPEPTTKPKRLTKEDWKTYQNEEYGFELKHPQDWTVGINQIDLPEECYTETSEKGYICKSGYLKFSESSKPQDQELVDYLNIKYADEQPQIYTEENVEKNILKLNGLIVSFGGMFGPRNAYIPIDNFKYLEIEAYAMDTDIFNQILSSFRFIDINKDEWKKYINEKEGFSIEYPSNWTTSEIKILDDQQNTRLLEILPVNITIYQADNFTLPVTNWLEKQKQDCLDLMNSEECKQYGCSDCRAGVEKFVKETFVNEYPATKISWESQGTGSWFGYFIVRENNVYKISLPQSFDEEVKDINNFDEEDTLTGEIYQKILSSFRFID